MPLSEAGDPVGLGDGPKGGLVDTTTGVPNPTGADAAAPLDAANPLAPLDDGANALARLELPTPEGAAAG